jgi:hypothetical protein
MGYYNLFDYANCKHFRFAQRVISSRINTKVHCYFEFCKTYLIFNTNVVLYKFVILPFWCVYYVRQDIKTAARDLVLHGIVSQSNRPNIINGVSTYKKNISYTVNNCPNTEKYRMNKIHIGRGEIARYEFYWPDIFPY